MITYNLINFSQNSWHCQEHIYKTGQVLLKIYDSSKWFQGIEGVNKKYIKSGLITNTSPDILRGNRSKSLQDEEQSTFYTNRELPLDGLTKSVLYTVVF